MQESPVSISDSKAVDETGGVDSSNNAIYVIQRLLRKKLLAKNNSSSTSAPTSSTPRKVLTQPQTVPKNIKSEEVNALLKCIGSKLQKG